MTDYIPDMPDDWWPNNLLIVAEQDGIELAFKVEHKGDDVKVEKASLMALRLCMWQRLASKAKE